MTLENGKWLLIAENNKISCSILLFRGEKELFELRLGKLGRCLDFTVLDIKLLTLKTKKMKYILSNEFDVSRMQQRINQLIKNKAKVEVIEVRRKRSTSQNSLYWLWMNCIAESTGHTSDEMHEFFKYTFLEGKVIQVGNVGQHIKPSTKDLDTKAFTTYLDKIKHFANEELCVQLLDPNDRLFEDFKFMYDAKKR